MAIKMRINKDRDAICENCFCERKECLDMFDIKIGDNDIITICDDCNEKLFNKSLKAVCYVNGRVKQPYEIRIRNERRQRAWKREHND